MLRGSVYTIWPFGLSVQPLKYTEHLLSGSHVYAPVEFPLEDGLSAATRGAAATLLSVGVDMFR
jgi:hypothetical protein